MTGAAYVKNGNIGLHLKDLKLYTLYRLADEVFIHSSQQDTNSNAPNRHRILHGEDTTYGDNSEKSSFLIATIDLFIKHRKQFLIKKS